MEPAILYEDDSVLVVNKPAGLIVHSDGRTDEPSLADWVLNERPALRDVGEAWVSPQGETVLRPGIVHRLDRGTSGVLVLAKTNEAYAFLKEQFKNRTLEKRYRALVYGAPKEDAGVIEAEITRIRSTPPRWGVAHRDETRTHRAATTEWSVLERFEGGADGEKTTYVEARPKTGRTHQIRVHFKYWNHPIVCDHLYAKGRPCLYGFARPALHAFSITLTLSSGARETFEAPLPDDFVKALAVLARQSMHGADSK
jgi:23S rRNA pseudouridine1911/1915/1917 synthase